MNKKVSLEIAFFSFVLLFFGVSCSDEEDNTDAIEKWKQYQQTVVSKAMAAVDEAGVKIYTPVQSTSGLGNVYTKPSDFIERSYAGDYPKDGPVAFSRLKKEEVDQALYETDEVVVRYEGWYYISDTVRYVFDSTESTTLTTKPVSNNGAVSDRQFQINGVVDGFKTALLDMKVGEERIVCIPQQMAYGPQGQYSTAGEQLVPGYTTLFFDIKLLKVLR